MIAPFASVREIRTDIGGIGHLRIVLRVGDLLVHMAELALHRLVPADQAQFGAVEAGYQQFVHGRLQSLLVMEDADRFPHCCIGHSRTTRMNVDMHTTRPAPGSRLAGHACGLC